MATSLFSFLLLVITISYCNCYPSQYRTQPQPLFNGYSNSYQPMLYGGDVDDEQDLFGDYFSSRLSPNTNNINNDNINFFNGDSGGGGNWNVAQEPAAAAGAGAYDQYLPSLEDYYLTGNDNDEDEAALLQQQQQQLQRQQQQQQQQQQWAELETLSNLLDIYDANQAALQEQPTWGHLVKEEPAELELEELKKKKKLEEAEHLSGGGGGSHGKIVQPVVKFLEKPVVAVGPTKATPPASSAAAVASATTTRAAPTLKSGQKEYPLLRPPVAGHNPKEQAQQHVAAEPVPVIAQRSNAERKPSPYDTLRKYISIEDALKKEAQKRRAEASSAAGGAAANNNKNSSRQKKSNFVANEESLTSQLNNLKKSVA